MKKTIMEWIERSGSNPILLFLFALGSLLILVGVTREINVPVLSKLASEGDYRMAATVLGISFVLLSTALLIRMSPLSTRPVKSMPPEVVAELSSSFKCKRDDLSTTQREFLEIIEKLSAGRQWVQEDTIMSEFMRRFGTRFRSEHGYNCTIGEAFYRLQHLRLLGFIEVSKVYEQTIALQNSANTVQQPRRYTLTIEYAHSVSPLNAADTMTPNPTNDS